MTKTKKRTRKPPPPRVIVTPEDAFWIGLATHATGRTQAEFVTVMLREQVLRLLRIRGIDPDKAWAEASKRR